MIIRVIATDIMVISVIVTDIIIRLIGTDAMVIRLIITDIMVIMVIRVIFGASQISAWSSVNRSLQMKEIMYQQEQA